MTQGIKGSLIEILNIRELMVGQHMLLIVTMDPAKLLCIIAYGSCTSFMLCRHCKLDNEKQYTIFVFNDCINSRIDSLSDARYLLQCLCGNIVILNHSLQSSGSNSIHGINIWLAEEISMKCRLQN